MGGKSGWIVVLAAAVCLVATSVSAVHSGAVAPPPGTIETVAGGFGIDEGDATDLHLNLAAQIAYFDKTVYVTDRSNNRVRAIDVSDGTFRTVAGYGSSGILAGGASAPATTSRIPQPYGVGIDPNGDLVVTSIASDNVVRVELGANTATHLSGRNPSSYGGDGNNAVTAQFRNPSDAAIDADGNIFIADTGNHAIRRIDADTGVITTVAGTGSAGDGADGADGVVAALDEPLGLAVDAAGNLLIADSGNHRVRMLTTDGTLKNVSGTGSAGFGGDGGSAKTAQLSRPTDVAIDDDGNVYIADQNNHRIRVIDADSGEIETVVGDGGSGTTGDGGPAGDAELIGPRSVAVGGDRIFVLDVSQKVRVVDGLDADATIQTLAGTGNDAPTYYGDGGPATEARIGVPEDVVPGDAGDYFIADTRNNVIRRVDRFGEISTVPGSIFNGPTTLLLHSGWLYYSTSGTFPAIFRLDPHTGVSQAVAGGSAAGHSGDGGPATDAQIDRPRDLAVDASGGILFADQDQAVVRRIDPVDGTIDTIAGLPGNDDFDIADDGAAADSVPLGAPNGLAVTGDGTILVALPSEHVVRAVLPDGTIDTFAGTGENDVDSADGGLATETELYNPMNVEVGPDGSVFIVERSGNRIRRVAPDGIVSTVAGTGSAFPGIGGDGGPATAAALGYPSDLFADCSGAITFLDDHNDRVRRVTDDHPCFVDVAPGHQFFDAVQWMATAAVSTGGQNAAGDLVYQPNNEVKRQAMAAFLYRLAGSPAIESTDPHFADVSASHQFFDAIQWMYEAGISTGYADGRYGPDDVVKRQAMAAFLHRIEGDTAPTPAAAYFSDVGAGHPFFDDIQWMYQANVTTGYADGRYGPTDVVKRQAMAAFLYRLYADEATAGVR